MCDRPLVQHQSDMSITGSLMQRSTIPTTSRSDQQTARPIVATSQETKFRRKSLSIRVLPMSCTLPKHRILIVVHVYAIRLLRASARKCRPSTSACEYSSGDASCARRGDLSAAVTARPSHGVLIPCLLVFMSIPLPTTAQNDGDDHETIDDVPSNSSIPMTPQAESTQREMVDEPRSDSPDQPWGHPHAGWWRYFGYAVRIIYLRIYPASQETADVTCCRRKPL